MHVRQSHFYLKNGEMRVSDSSTIEAEFLIDAGGIGISYSDLTDASISDSLIGLELSPNSTEVEIVGSLISGLKSNLRNIQLINSYAFLDNPPMICTTGEPVKFISLRESEGPKQISIEGIDPFRDFVVSMEHVNGERPWSINMEVALVEPPKEYLAFVNQNCN